MRSCGPASDARALAAGLLRRAMDSRAEIDLSSYDRLFPSQDTLPKGGFGNLIALPLQGECATRGTTMFIDPSTMRPWTDQWAFLSDVARLHPEALGTLIEAVGQLAAGPSAARRRFQRDTPAPESVRAALGPMLTLDLTRVPVWLVADLKHLASLRNPEFYKRQRLRLSTWSTPRLVRCYEKEPGRLHLPRGLVERVEALLADYVTKLDLEDQRPDRDRVEISFRGRLTPAQGAALERLIPHDHGVLVAATGSGKTVVGCAVIAHHQVPTLVRQAGQVECRGPRLRRFTISPAAPHAPCAARCLRTNGLRAPLRRKAQDEASAGHGLSCRSETRFARPTSPTGHRARLSPQSDHGDRHRQGRADARGGGAT